MDIADWLKNLDLEQYAPTFLENDISISLLPDLSDADLKELGVKSLGHRKLLLRQIAGLADSEASATSPPLPNSMDDTAPQAERRHLTVMFCDLVGSTELSGRLDPEALREVMRAYQDAVGGAVTRYGGYVAKLLGDGVLVYFGWPQAYEDQAERAVLAARDTLANVAGVGGAPDDMLQVRVGIASGPVVVGDFISEAASEAGAVTGETPNLAARLQGIAAPGQVVISDATRRLLRRAFRLEDLGHRTLKGFSEPVRAWAAHGADDASTRFESRVGARSSKLIGRDTELQLLLDRWQTALEGESQTVLVSGEAGIGKSMLLHAFSEAPALGDALKLRFQCSPYHINSALYPVAQHLERSAAFDAEDNFEARLDKLEALFAEDDTAPDVAIFADLLSLPYAMRYERIDLPPHALRERLFAALTDRVLQLVRRTPVLLIFEDAHWIDPTTLELLQRTLDLCRTQHLLCVITHRPEWRPPQFQSNLTSLQLNRLSRRQILEIVRDVAGAKIPVETCEHIVQRTDGVPLFAEEVAMAVAQGAGDAKDRQVPTSLQASLMERLDRMGEAKEIAQIGSIVGREFSFRLLGAVMDWSSEKLDAGLARLVEAGVLFSRGLPPEAEYVFKHALLRDAAYNSLLLASRRDWHCRLGEAIESHFPAASLGEPEVLARHWREGGRTEKALPLLIQAGRNAARRSASTEAIAHYAAALALFDAQADADKTHVREFEILSGYCPALMTTRGFADPEVGDLLQRAHDVGRLADGDVDAFQVTWNLWLHNQVAGRISMAGDLAKDVVRMADKSADKLKTLEAHHAVWTTALNQGDLKTAWDSCAEGIAIYVPDIHHESTFTYGNHDPGVCGQGHAGKVLALMGMPEQALRAGQEAVDLARATGHGPSQTMALAFQSLQLVILQAPERLPSVTKACIDAADRFGPKHFRTFGMVGRGWGKAIQGDVDAGAEDIKSAIDFYRRTGALIRLPPFYWALADILYRARKFDQAMDAVEAGLTLIAEDADKSLWADLVRLHGAILISDAPTAEKHAEAEFRRAIEIAREQHAMLLELLTCPLFQGHS